MDDLRLLRESVDEWLCGAAAALRTEYPDAYVQAHSHYTYAFAMRAGLSVTRRDRATATEDVVVSVDMKRDGAMVSADVALGSGEVLEKVEERGLDAVAVGRVRAFLDSAVETVRRTLT